MLHYHGGPGAQMDDTRLAERRGGQPSFWYPERRTGFDRRAKPLELAKPSDSVVVLLLCLFVMMSAFDWIFTKHALGMGAVEANPLLNYLLTHTSWAFAFKAAFTLVVVGAFWLNRKYKYVVVTLAGAVTMYATLMVYHIVNF